MKKYKVRFSGFAYVEAENEEEAIEAYDYEDVAYQESEVTGVQEVSDFTIMF